MVKEALFGRDAIFRETFNNYESTVRNGWFADKGTLKVTDGELVNVAVDSSDYDLIANKNIDFSNRTAFTINWTLNKLGEDAAIQQKNPGNTSRVILGFLSNILWFEVMNGDSTYIKSYGSYANGYYTITAVFDGSLSTPEDRLKVYINGELVSTSSMNPTLFPSETGNYHSSDLHSGIEIGHFFSGAHPCNIKTSLFEVYDYGMSAEEVSALYNGNLYVKPSEENALINMYVEGNSIINKGSLSPTSIGSEISCVKDNSEAISYTGLDESEESNITFYNPNPNTATFTFSVWYKILGNVADNYHALYSQSSVKRILVYNTGSILFQMTGFNIVTSVYDNKEWHNLTVVADYASSNRFKIYVDGKLDSQTTSYSTLLSGNINTGMYTSSFYHIKGLQNDYLVIPDVAWTAKEVARRYNATKGRYK